MAEHLIMYPADAVKTVLQTAPAQRPATFAEAVAVVRLRGPFRGASAVALSAAPAHALCVAHVSMSGLRYLTLAFSSYSYLPKQGACSRLGSVVPQHHSPVRSILEYMRR